MKVRMLQTAAGPDGTFEEGKEYRVPEDLTQGAATAFLNAGAAEAVREEEVEVALKSPVEAAAAKPKQVKRRKQEG